MRQLLFRVRAVQGGGAEQPTKEEVSGVKGARLKGARLTNKQTPKQQLNQKCDLKSARCFCEACAPLKGDAYGQIHCFHCQCEGYPQAKCEFDASTLKEKKKGWLW